MTEPEIVIDNLTKRFEDITAVDGLCLNIIRAEFFGLLGPNGAGKATTINVLCGLTELSGRSIIIAGHDIQKVWKVWKKIRHTYKRQRTIAK